MGTNYYFVPKKFNKQLYDNMWEAYRKDILDILNIYEMDMCNYMKNITDIKLFNISKLDKDRILNSIDTPEFKKLHICKLSCGWVPLLQTTDFYSSIYSLKQFYIRFKNDVKVINEYYEDMDFQELITELEDRNNNKDNKLHSDYPELNIQIDDTGYQWTDIEFS